MAVLQAVTLEPFGDTVAVVARELVLFTGLCAALFPIAAPATIGAIAPD